jgi:hypothetical protein
VRDAALEAGTSGVLLVEVQRVGVAAGGREVTDVVGADGLRELEAVAHGQRVGVVRAQFRVPLRQVAVGIDPFRGGVGGADLAVRLDAECRERRPVRGHDAVEHVGGRLRPRVQQRATGRF